MYVKQRFSKLFTPDKIPDHKILLKYNGKEFSVIYIDFLRKNVYNFCQSISATSYTNYMKTHLRIFATCSDKNNSKLCNIICFNIKKANYKYIYIHIK